MSARVCVCVCVCHLALCGRILLYFPAQTCIVCVSTQSIALSAAPAAASRFFALSTYKFSSQCPAQPPPFGFCLSCEQLSCCKFIDSLYTCGCSLATFVFLVCAARARISMCKLIKASKSKLKHFAPAACGNSIQLNRLVGNKSLSHLPFILAQHDSRIINSILGAETKLGLELSLSAHIDRHTHA